MKAFLVLVLCGFTWAATPFKVSEDCLWGRQDAATCCKDIPEGDPTHLANPKECSSFYTCKDHQPMLFPCLPGQIWNVNEQKCTASDDPKHCDQVRARFVRKVSEDCLWGRQDAATCCKDIPEGDPTHLANPKECSSFYTCKDHQPMLFPCLPGQIWNVNEQKCTVSDDPKHCDQVRARFVRKVSEDCLWGRQDAATCCKDIPEGDPTHLANPKECSSFYTCKDHQPMLFPCLPGQIWNVKEQKCTVSDDPKHCDQVRARFVRKVSEDCLWGRQDAATCCKDIPEGDPTHLANPKECSSFYTCKDHQPMLFPCLPGQIWNVNEQKCTVSDDPKHCDQVRARFVRKVSEDCLWGRQDAATCCKDIPEGDPTHLANPKECSSFYTCKDHQPMLFPCLPGQIWNVNEQKCTASDDPKHCDQVRARFVRKVSEDCLWGRQDAATCCKDIPEGDPTHLANPKECSSFYTCKDHQPVLFPCLPGQIWNVNDQKCEKVSNTSKCDQKQY